jgi:hypothetical protein
MKSALTFLVLSLLVLSVLPGVLAISIGGGFDPTINPEEFEPRVWMCNNRVVYDDATEPGRISPDGTPLVERLFNYAFEGEQISWQVLVMDKNGIEKVVDVYATVGTSQGAGNGIEVNCQNNLHPPAGAPIPEVCNAQIHEEELEEFDPDTMGVWDCLLTVETPVSMYGEHWITVEAIDADGLMGTMAENEYWFLNPVIALALTGDLEFDEVLPGTFSYSETVLVGNDADVGSGVVLDMFISGTDFYDSSSSGAACPISNQLLLGDGDSFCDVGSAFNHGVFAPIAGDDGVDDTDPFCYFATGGAYSTAGDARSDAEGYVGINHGIGFNDPAPFYGLFDGDGTGFEIMQGLMAGPYFVGNSLTPGAEHAVTFRLALPEPCNGNFDTGSIFVWGEAI